MKLNRIMLVSSLLLLLALIVDVRASEVIVTIEPADEVAQNVECPIGCQSIGGNVATNGGNIDFCITDPLGKIILYYENISFIDFEANTPTNGTYVILMTNRLFTNNVTATLFYCRDIVVVLQVNVSVRFSSVATPTTSGPSSSNPWGSLGQIGFNIFVYVVAPLLARLLYDLIRGKYQKWKDGKSRTPVVMR